MIYRPHPLDQGFPSSWASAWGEDDFGVYESFRVGQVEQRMRWIEGGTFPLGSPPDEVDRSDWEFPVRSVEVAGFWLADTPCTQELWQAVMGSNPSRFQSPTRPVEQVTWDECREFCRKLGERVSGLRLPTEDEWEYACRARTREATWVGNLEILGDHNAPILDDIAWYGGNCGRDYDLEEGHDTSGWYGKQYPDRKAGTRRVALKRPNPWGLYDMLGNVWQWCEDEFRYPDGIAAIRGGVDRVVRGGSWVSLAQVVRAASRVRKPPSDRGDALGFRLARSQEEAAPGQDL